MFTVSVLLLLTINYSEGHPPQHHPKLARSHQPHAPMYVFESNCPYIVVCTDKLRVGTITVKIPRVCYFYFPQHFYFPPFVLPPDIEVDAPVYSGENEKLSPTWVSGKHGSFASPQTRMWSAYKPGFGWTFFAWIVKILASTSSVLSWAWSLV